jgi:alkylation response protein AidB-like acyl-CoA dehydrogenase
VTQAPLLAVDGAARGSGVAYVLVPEGEGHRLARVEGEGAGEGADLTRRVRRIAAGTPVRPVPGQSQLLGRADLASWTALGLALTSADAVGLMRGVLDLSVAYAQERKQYGVAIGTFQAVQHLLAEARCLLEGAFSAAAYPAWAVDSADPEEATRGGRVAKAYADRAARTVCETAVQVHGGMGNTWDCMVHVYLRRALLSSRWFGGAGEQLRELQRTRLGAVDGLS